MHLGPIDDFKKASQQKRMVGCPFEINITSLLKIKSSKLTFLKIQVYKYAKMSTNV
jgi:hypothetical protein